MEYETYLLIPNSGESVPAQFLGVFPVENVVTSGGSVHAAEDVQHCGFPGSACPHDGDEFTRVDVKAHPAEGVHNLVAHLEVATEVLDGENGSPVFHSCLLTAI